ncbi:bifunctional PIG-L family deacetylase/class I SAM-dependent methyltransferase [Pseudonocardia sp. N23]|uniref:bifunctional PIG-L family deacetylase/class I SAM-dependent methyltransferase n=1 Tax=Pseudonocardia sp. N23 TaxID=1987376 RepID=UPI000C0343F8|nr:bifunctional PIG-L family deacetylase/class I SAM-dependent methyltransferase [Pseudonocardia sp. N23]GAY08022.1 methyltransferase type 12 [Pseudonocardia sp. N23]
MTLTAPQVWADALATHDLPPMDVAGAGPLVVVAAHPDDETLGAGGYVAAVHSAGAEVRLVVATDGEAAYPDLDPDGRAALGRARREELRDALRTLGLADVDVTWLGLPDSGLAAHHDTLVDALRPLLDGATTCLAPWSDDPHPDHAAVGAATTAAAPLTTHCWAFPIWACVRGTPDDVALPWDRAARHDLGATATQDKRDAVARFATQVGAPPGGGAPVLPPEVLAHFDTGVELFLRSPRRTGAPASRFADLYATADGDPWSTRTSWYERRKRAVTMACLPREHYRRAAEPGCGTGELTRELAGRCDTLHASDFAPAAVATAGAAVAASGHVTVSQAALPTAAALPDGLDLAVLSEVLYYLSAPDLDATIDRLADAVDPGGDVVVVHWRGWPADAPHDTRAVRARFDADDRFVPLVEHLDGEFALHVRRRR